MALFSIFKAPKNQRFEYKPRYWDPKKEDLDQRVRMAKNEGSNDPEGMKQRISNGFKRGSSYGYEGIKAKQMRKSNYFLVAIIFVLLALSYLFLTVYLPEIVAAVEGNSAK